MLNFFNKCALALALLIVASACTIIPAGYKPISKGKDEMIYKRQGDFDDNSFYRHKSFFRFSPLELYIGEGETTYARLVFKYGGVDWIFFNKAVLINSKGVKMNFMFESYNRDTQVISGGGVVESYDVALSSSRFSKLSDLLKDNSEPIRIKLSGKQYYKEYTLTSTQVLALNQMINKYRSLIDSQ